MYLAKLRYQARSSAGSGQREKEEVTMMRGWVTGQLALTGGETDSAEVTTPQASEPSWESSRGSRENQQGIAQERATSVQS